MHFVCIGTDPFTVTRRPMDIAFYAVYCGRAPCTSSALVQVLQRDPKSYGRRHYSQELRLPSIQLREKHSLRITRIDGVLRSYDAVGGDRMTPRMITMGTAR